MLLANIDIFVQSTHLSRSGSYKHNFANPAIRIQQPSFCRSKTGAKLSSSCNNSKYYSDRIIYLVYTGATSRSDYSN